MKIINELSFNFILTFLLIFFQKLYAGNILFLYCHDMNSHLGSMIPYLKQ